MDEAALTGGNSNTVTRIGDTVHRTAGAWTPAVHRLLAVLRSAGVTEVPEPLGFDDDGREVLSFLPGDVGAYPLPGWLWGAEIIDDAGALLRRVHDASTELVREDLVWATAPHEPAEVICHNDAAPYNMTFANGRVTGLFDFDAASPGPRIWDLAYLAYRLAPFGEDALGHGLTVEERLNRVDRLIGAYGQPFRRAKVLETAAIRLTELAEYTEGRLRETGTVDFGRHAAMYCRDAVRIAALATT